MATTIESAFIKQFEREVHEAYQRLGSKLRSAVRSKNSVQGSSTVFQKVGKGTASTKARHGSVPTMNIDHTAVECVLADYYAGDWVDKLDELKINIDERQVIASAGAYIMAFTWAFQMLALAYVIVAEPESAGIVINAMDSLSTIWTVGLSVLGIYVYKRSQEKRTVNSGSNFFKTVKANLQQDR